MATIVQPYDPWREKLAASILGPLVGNMIQKGQEAEQNRKRNAMLAAWTDANAVQDPLTGGAISTVPDPLAKQDFTLGFDSDLRPWANSLVDNGALPQMGMSMAAPAQPQAPTLTSLFQLGGTKRFGGVNMDTVMPFAKELLAEQEAQRQSAAAAQRQAEIKQYADSLLGIEGENPYIRAVANGVIRGYYDHNVLKNAVDWSKHQTPHHEFKNFNTNETMYGIDFDPGTGQGRQMFSAPMGISQYQAGQLANEQHKNTKGTPVYGGDGILYNVDPYEGTAKPYVTADGSPLKINPRNEAKGQGSLSDVDDAIIKRLAETQKKAHEELNSLNDIGVLMAEEERPELALQNAARRAELQKQLDDAAFQMYLIGVRNDPDSPVLRVQAKQNGWPMPEELASSNFVTDGTKTNGGVLFPGDTAGVVSGDIRPEAPQAAGQGDIPGDLMYDAKRDANTPQENIVSQQQFRAMMAAADRGDFKSKNINNAQEFIANAQRTGWRVK